MNSQKRLEISDVKFVKEVAVGSVNPNVILSDGAREAQTALLNRCLNEYPKGIILGKDIAIGRYAMGEHELVMQKTIYHIGFPRKPAWLNEKGAETK
ncbi:MAG: hypothetical protein LBC70_07920 [Chitinispirillales bacterium]|jgi:hypothetical protein|nr:hypothetical protein [Chitinispirillales bacterium]